MSKHSEECGKVHDAVSAAVHAMSGEMLLSTVVIAVTIDPDGRKALSCWTSPDQRHWETIGLLEYVRMDHGAYLSEQRIVPQED